MNDRELLELAAKAVGVKVSPVNSWLTYSDRHGFQWMNMDGSAVTQSFNPLNDDGDALRLARTLQFELDFDCEEGAAVRHSSGIKIIDSKYRRAIVRAAAEIGKGMK